MKAQEILHIFHSYNNTPNLVFFDLNTQNILHVFYSNNHIANSTKCHFHGPKQGNNQRGKIPHLLKCVGSVLDPPKSKNNGGKSFLLPFSFLYFFFFFLDNSFFLYLFLYFFLFSFLPFFLFFLSFSLFFLLLLSTNCLPSLLKLPGWFDLGEHT